MFRTLPLVVMLFFSLIADCSASSSSIPPSTQSSSWKEAQSLYQAGKYQEALQTLRAHPEPNNALYFYDLGTISYHLGEKGAALGYFEKANRLKRHDPDIRHNLDVVQADLAQSLGSNGLDPASTWSESLADQVSLNEIRAVLGLFGLLLTLVWIRGYSKTRHLKKTFLSPSALIGTTMLLIVVGLYGIETIANGHPPAIALKRMTVRSGPGSSYAELAQVNSGVTVRWLGRSSADSSDLTVPGLAQDPTPDSAQKSLRNSPETSPGISNDEWYQVRYSQDGIGWVRSSGFMVIN